MWGGPATALSADVRGTINEQLIHANDWMPTFVAAASSVACPARTEELIAKIESATDGLNMWDVIYCS